LSDWFLEAGKAEEPKGEPKREPGDSPPLGEAEQPGGKPNPGQRADFVVMRLEQFIREGRTIAEGMSFKQWKEMARVEIAVAIAATENALQDDDVVTKRLLFTMSAALVTIGFWGAAFAFGKSTYWVVAVICGIAGVALLAVAGEWRWRRYIRTSDSRKRRRILARVEDLTRRIRRMERELEAEAKILERRIKETSKAAAIVKAKADAGGD
jgi:hypothetical protein